MREKKPSNRPEPRAQRIKQTTRKTSAGSLIRLRKIYEAYLRSVADVTNKSDSTPTEREG